jgi:hypothetical protein
MQKQAARAEDQKPDITKTKEYRRFHKLLKQAIKAPPMKRPSLPHRSNG